jgi:hypothetical protein
MRQEGQAALSLDDAVPQSAPHGEPGQGRRPCGFLQPPRADRRRMLAPAPARCHGGGLLRISLQHLGLCTGRSTYRGRQPRPAIVRLWVGQPRHLHHEALARFHRGWLRLRWASPLRRARATGICYAAIAYRLLAPGAGAAAALARPVALRLGDGGCYVRQAGQPPRWPLRAVGCHRSGVLRLASRSGWGVLVRQLLGMHHAKPECLHGAPPIPIFPLSLPEDALAMPTAGLLPWSAQISPPPEAARIAAVPPLPGPDGRPTSLELTLPKCPGAPDPSPGCDDSTPY